MKFISKKRNLANTFFLFQLFVLLYFLFSVQILIVEFVLATQHPRSNTSDSQPGWRYVFLNHELPAWLMEAYKKIGIFVFGGAVSQLTTDIAKYSIGRLRPHFLTVNTAFYILS